MISITLLVLLSLSHLLQCVTSDSQCFPQQHIRELNLLSKGRGLFDQNNMMWLIFTTRSVESLNPNPYSKIIFLFLYLSSLLILLFSPLSLYPTPSTLSYYLNFSPTFFIGSQHTTLLSCVYDTKVSITYINFHEYLHISTTKNFACTIALDHHYN